MGTLFDKVGSWCGGNENVRRSETRMLRLCCTHRSFCLFALCVPVSIVIRIRMSMGKVLVVVVVVELAVGRAQVHAAVPDRPKAS